MVESEPNPLDSLPTFRSTPDARPYTHLGCGGVTTISGAMFSILCDPFKRVTGTYCVECQRHARPKDVIWTDTGENVAAYRARMREATPARAKWWRGNGWALLIILGLTLGFAAGIPFLSTRSIAGPFIGIIIGFFISLVPAFLVIRKYSIDYRKYR